MFEKNDKALLITRIIFLTIIWMMVVASFVVGIVLAVIIDGVFFLVAFAGWFMCWLLWVFERLYLSYLCDVKLIRNKLYGKSNEGLEVFLKPKDERSNSPAVIAKREAREAELKHLQQLLDSAVITAEEYEQRKKELTAEE